MCVYVCLDSCKKKNNKKTTLATVQLSTVGICENEKEREREGPVIHFMMDVQDTRSGRANLALFVIVVTVVVVVTRIHILNPL